MITIKSLTDLQKVPSNHPAYHLLHELTESLINGYTWEGHPYAPEDHGYIVLIDSTDASRVLAAYEMPYRLIDIPWEGVTLRDGFFHAVYLANNDFWISFLVPDEDWVSGPLRETLEANLDPPFALFSVPYTKYHHPFPEPLPQPGEPHDHDLGNGSHSAVPPLQ